MSPNSYIFSEAPNFEEDFFEKHKKHAIKNTPQLSKLAMN